MYVTWSEPSSDRVIVPILPPAPLPAEAVEPAGTVSAGHVARHDPVHALLPLLAVSFAKV